VTGLRLSTSDSELAVFHGDAELTRYVYRPPEPQVESPRPYFYPVRTLGGDLVSLYRPHDHVWHKGIAWSLPNVERLGDPPEHENFWGGVTYLRGAGYQQIANNGAMRHREFRRLDSSADLVEVGHELDWLTQRGDHWGEEYRWFAVTVDDGAWVLSFSTRLTNTSGATLRFGSPTTQGRPNAGYGGLFWRGPRSFSGGTVLAPGVAAGDELMGTTAPWLGFTGRHDGRGGASSIVFVSDPAGPPDQWFVRSEIYACICPAPFFDTEVDLAPGDALSHRYSVVVADGAADPDRAAQLAELGAAVLAQPVRPGR
jgi:hypothetical protein